jgi:hypothetical protein
MKRNELLDLIVIEAKARHENKFIGHSRYVAIAMPCQLAYHLREPLCMCSPEAAIGLIVQMVGFCVRLSDMAGFLLWRIQVLISQLDLVLTSVLSSHDRFLYLKLLALI